MFDKQYKLSYPFTAGSLTSINLETDCENRGNDSSYVLESAVSKALD